MGNVRMRAEQINYGASNVKAALDTLDPAALISLSNRMDRVDAWKATVKTEEKTGASVEYTNALALDAVSVSADITASQDLHGYDKPWAGGAGFNKLDDDTMMIGYISQGDGQDVADPSGHYWRTTGYIPVHASTDYYNRMPNGYTINNANNTLYYYDTTKQYLGKSANVGDSIITTPNNCAYIRLVTYFVNVVTTEYPSGLCFNVSDISKNGTWEPYSNICPITGFSSVTITDVDAESQTASVTVALGQTVYGGTLDLTSGELTITHANIASYNGETIGVPWISSMDEYTQGGTPTTGAQVVYPLATPTTATLTAAQVALVPGYNRLSANTGNITVEAYTGAAWGGDAE